MIKQFKFRLNWARMHLLLKNTLESCTRKFDFSRTYQAANFHRRGAKTWTCGCWATVGRSPSNWSIRTGRLAVARRRCSCSSSSTVGPRTSPSTDCSWYPRSTWPASRTARSTRPRATQRCVSSSMVPDRSPKSSEPHSTFASSSSCRRHPSGCSTGQSKPPTHSFIFWRNFIAPSRLTRTVRVRKNSRCRANESHNHSLIAKFRYRALLRYTLPILNKEITF